MQNDARTAARLTALRKSHPLRRRPVVAVIAAEQLRRFVNVIGTSAMVLRRESDSQKLTQHLRYVGIIVNDENANLFVIHISILAEAVWNYRAGF